MRLAFFSPLPPARSGIADYSEALVKSLAPLVDLQVLWALGAAALSWFNRHHMPQHSDLLFHETNTAY